MVNWDHLGPISSYTFTNLQVNQWIRVYFAAILDTITATAGPNGQVFPSGSVQLQQGSSRTFTFAPAAGYQVSTLAIDGGAPQPYSAKSYTFSNVQANHSIAVTFAPNP